MALDGVEPMTGPSRSRSYDVWLRLLLYMGLSVLSWYGLALAEVPVAPQQYDLSFAKGVLKFNQGKYDEARTFFAQALDAKPGDMDATYYLGQSLVRTRRYPEAERIFRALVDAEPASGKSRLGLAMAQYYQAKYMEALKNLEEAQGLLPNDPLVPYFQGLAYNRLGSYDQATASLNRAMQLSPELSQEGHYQLGVAEYGRGRFEEAKSQFEAALATEPTSELAQAARVYLTELSDPGFSADRRRLDPTQQRTALPRLQEKKSWDLLFNMSPQYDSNVVLLPLGVQPPGGTTGISRKDDFRTVFTARGEYRPLQTDTWTVGTAYGFYQSFHRTLHTFDVQDHTPSVYLQHRYGRFQSRVDYLFDYVTVGRSPFLLSHALRPVFSVREGESWFTQVQLGYQNKDFKDDRFALNSTRDGKNWLFGIQQFYHFAENAGVVRVGYVFDTDRTGGGSPAIATAPTNADWAYTGHRISTGVRIPTMWTITPDITFDYYRQNYDNPNSFSPGGRTVRKDDIFVFSAALSRPISKNVSVGLQYSYTRDNSNVSVFDYVRSVYSLSLSASF